MTRLPSVLVVVGSFVALASAARAQAIETWERRIDRSPFSDWCADARVAADGTTTLFGAELDASASPDPANAPGHATVTRVDPQGQVVWASDYDAGAPTGAQTRFVRGALDANGGSCALATSRPVPGAALPVDAHVVRYDAQGTVVWTAVQPNCIPRDVVIESSGNTWVVARVPVPNWGYDVLVLRYDASGALTLGAVWGGETNLNDDPLRVVLDGQGGVYVAVHSTLPPNRSVYVVRMAADSSVSWVTRVEGVNEPWLDIAVDGSSAVYLGTGRTYSGWASNMRVLQLDPATGSVRWERGADLVPLHAGVVRPKIAVHPFGGVAAACELGGTIHARRYDAFGELLWSTHLPEELGSLEAMAVDAEGALHLAGHDFNGDFRLDVHATKILAHGGIAWRRRHSHGPESCALRGFGVGPLGSTILVGELSLLDADTDVEIVRYDDATSAFCSGDGSGASCPCGNSGAPGNGCANTVQSAGANLASTGSAYIGADDYVLVGSGMTNGSVLYFQGTAGSSGSAFGDGLRCATGSIVRLGAKTNVAGASSYPEPFDAPVSVRGGIVGGTQTRTYQAWYRNVAPFCTPAGFNLTNGLSVIWSP